MDIKSERTPTERTRRCGRLARQDRNQHYVVLPRLAQLLPYPSLVLDRVEIGPPFPFRPLPRSNVLCINPRCNPFSLWSLDSSEMNGIDGSETPGCILLHYDRHEV
jgi:hypothetical protein